MSGKLWRAPKRCIFAVRYKELVEALKGRGLRITTAESCTGGGIAAAITSVSGSSAVFPGGVVSYCDNVKHRVLGVPRAYLQEFGAVSAPVAEAMAAGAAELMETELAVSATGLAGPDGDGSDNPVGTVFLGLYFRGMTRAEHHVFSGSREEIRRQAVERAAVMALECLEEEA